MVAAFAALITVGAALLFLPISVDQPASGLGWRDALFWSTSASTVTGLGTVDIAEFSLFGELTILALIQIGGFGIMSIGSVLALVSSRRIGLRQRMLAQAELGAVSMGEIRHLIGAIAKITVAVEAAVAVAMFVHLVRSGDADAGPAAYQAVFHGISAFNNAGISPYSNSLVDFAASPMVVLPITIGFIIGGLGFPVLVELRRRRSPTRWSLHTRLTLLVTGALLVVGPIAVLALEWTNPGSLGSMDIGQKLQAAWFQGVTPRTAGFSTVDIGALEEPTLLTLIGLMFVGGGPASTAGGIKVTTFAVLLFAIWSELRGDDDVNVVRRRVPLTVLRQALAVALLGIGLVFVAGIVLSALSGFGFTDTLFEATSAFGTVGLSTGITASLPAAGQLLLVVLMLVGRVGPVTFITALALRERRRAYRYAEERPIIG